MNYKIIKGSMAGGFDEGDIITEQDLIDNGVGLERAFELGVIEAVEEERVVATVHEGLDPLQPSAEAPPEAEPEVVAEDEAFEPIPKDDLHHMTAKSKGLVLNDEGTHWVQSTEE